MVATLAGKFDVANFWRRGWGCPAWSLREQPHTRTCTLSFYSLSSKTSLWLSNNNNSSSTTTTTTTNHNTNTTTNNKKVDSELPQKTPPISPSCFVPPGGDHVAAHGYACTLLTRMYKHSVCVCIIYVYIYIYIHTYISIIITIIIMIITIIICKQSLYQ